MIENQTRTWMSFVLGDFLWNLFYILGKRFEETFHHLPIKPKCKDEGSELAFITLNANSESAIFVHQAKSHSVQSEF